MEQASLFSMDDDDERREYQAPLTGKFHGAGPTGTERESGEAIEIRELGPLKPGSAGHKVLTVYESGDRMTAYDASFRLTGEAHSKRRDRGGSTCAGSWRRTGRSRTA
jgi:hypothetical protein